VKTTPSVWRGKPEAHESDEYVELKVGNVTVFAHQSLQGFDSLEIVIAGAFFWQKLTLSGLPAEVHDSVTLNPGSFDKTVAAIEKLKAVGIPVRIAVIIMKANEHDIENIQKLCITLDCETAVDIVRPTGRGDDAGLVPTSYRKPLIRPPFFTNEYSFTRAHYYHNCLAGKLAVTASGDVIPCIFARRQVCGNILTAPLAEILQNQPLQACWRTTKDQIAKCKDCEYRYACFDCRPLAQCGDSRNCWLTCHVGCAYNPYTGEWQDDPSQPGK